MDPPDDCFQAALDDLRQGNFSRLAPCFVPRAELQGRSRIEDWFARRRFDAHRRELEEAFTCACFLGATATVALLLGAGLPATGGSATGMNALHCAASRGEVETVRLLLQHGVPLELENRYGGTALAQAVWSALNQPMPGQVEAAQELLRAGADTARVRTPTGDARIDELLAPFRKG